MSHDASPQADIADVLWRRSPALPVDPGEIDPARLDRAELQLLADNLPTLCWIANGDGYIVWYNRRWHDYCGTTPVEMEGWGWRSVHDPDVLPDVLARWTDCIATGEAFEMVFPIRGRDGTFRPFLTRITPLKDTAGRVLRWLGANIDISAQRKMEEALAESQASLRVLNADLERQVVERSSERGTTWQLSPHLLSVIDLTDGCFVRVNPAWTVTLGWAERELAGKAFADFVHPEDVAALGPAWAEVTAGHPILNFENRYRARDGSIRWLSWVCVPEHDKLYSSARDITREKEQAALIAVRTRERDRLWNASEDLLVVADEAGRLIRINPSWIRLFGYGEDELLASAYGAITHPEDLNGVLAAFAEMRASGKPSQFENRMRTADGRWRVILWSFSPDVDGLELTGVGHDLTDHREIEERLRQSQKMEAVGQLTGGLAHDFNNLLTGISGNLQLLQSRIAQGRADEAGRYVGAAQGAVERATALTHRLLAFSRRQTLSPTPTDVNRLIGGMEELIRRTVGPHIHLEVVGAIGLWATLVDGNQLENALLNLCINARDAMPDGGRITIETANRQLDDRMAADRDLTPGQYVSLCVIDTGTGMTAEVVARAFDPFFTTKPLGSGTGLGLSMIYGFARQSGGQVRADSEVGVGTTMCIYLPRHAVAAADPTQAGAALPPAQAAPGETILVVDDEPLVRGLITEVVEEAGYLVLEAADGRAGLRILQSAARVDLVITDVGLPGGLNGRQMADAARVRRPDLKILFITGYAENAVIGRRPSRRRHGHPDQTLFHGGPERQDPRGDGGARGGGGAPEGERLRPLVCRRHHTVLYLRVSVGRLVRPRE